MFILTSIKNEHQQNISFLYFWLTITIFVMIAGMTYLKRRGKNITDYLIC